MELNFSSSNPEDPKEILLKVVDPRHNTPFERSKTAFVSINQSSGTIVISAFLARLMGLLSGDRIMLIKSPSNTMIWFIAKTQQREKTKPVRILKGVYRINSKKQVAEFSESFRFNKDYKGYIRLYVNTDKPITLNNFGGVKAYQLFDIPDLRDDFKTEEEKTQYVEHIKNNPYIIKQK